MLHLVRTQPDFVKCLAAVLRSRKGKAKVKNADLSDALGTSKQTVSSWLQGKGRAIRSDSLLLLCEELGTSADDVIAEAVRMMDPTREGSEA